MVSDGEVRRGFTGIAGEVAHLVTVGPEGRAMLLTEVFQELGLRQAGTTAIDVAVLLDAFDGRDAVTGPVRAAVGAALSGVLAALVAVCDPEVVILGGEWGGHPAVIDTVRARVPQSPRHVPIRPATVTEEPALSGARRRALEDLRTAIVARSAPCDVASVHVRGGERAGGRGDQADHGDKRPADHGEQPRGVGRGAQRVSVGLAGRYPDTGAAGEHRAHDSDPEDAAELAGGRDHRRRYARLGRRHAADTRVRDRRVDQPEPRAEHHQGSVSHASEVDGESHSSKAAPTAIRTPLKTSGSVPAMRREVPGHRRGGRHHDHRGQQG